MPRHWATSPLNVSLSQLQLKIENFWASRILHFPSSSLISAASAVVVPDETHATIYIKDITNDHARLQRRHIGPWKKLYHYWPVTGSCRSSTTAMQKGTVLNHITPCISSYSKELCVLFNRSLLSLTGTSWSNVDTDGINFAQRCIYCDMELATGQAWKAAIYSDNYAINCVAWGRIL